MANPKKPRTAKQKAATRRMIAARKAQLRGAPKRNAKGGTKRKPKRNTLAKRNPQRTAKQQAATRKMIAARRAQLRGAPKRNAKGKSRPKRNPKDGAPSLLMPFDTWGEAGAFGGALAVTGIAQHALFKQTGILGSVIRAAMDLGLAYGARAGGMDSAAKAIAAAGFADIVISGLNMVLTRWNVGSLELGAEFVRQSELDLGAFVREELGAFQREGQLDLGAVLGDLFDDDRPREFGDYNPLSAIPAELQGGWN